MDTTATIKFLLQADTQQFSRALDDAKRKEQSFTSSVSAGLGKVATAATAAAAAAAVAAGAAIARAIGEADEAAKAADKLGIATDKLIGLQFAANEAGASQETLQRGLRDSQRILAENGKEFQAWAQKLGLSVDELRKQSPDQLVKTYADAIAGLNSRGEQFAAVSGLMGAKSQELTGLLIQGSAAISEAEELTRKYGAALSDIEVEQLRQVDDAFDRAGLAAKGAGNILAVAFAPVIEAVVADLTDAVTGTDDFKIAVQTAAETGYVAFKLLGGAVDVIQASFQANIGFLYQIRAAFNALTGDTAEASQYQQAANRWMQAAQSNLLELKTIEELRAQFQVLAADSERRAKEAADRRASLRNEGLTTGTSIAEQVQTEFNRQKAPTLGVDLDRVPDSFGQAILEQQQAIDELRIEAAQDFSDRLLDITGTRIDQELLLEQFKAQQSQSIGQNLTSSAFGIAKTLFGNNKKFAIAEAIVGTYAGAAKALATVPFPANIAAAAAVVANGLAQVRRIKSTNPGGGGAGGSVGSSSIGSPPALDFGGGQNSEVTGATNGKAVQVIVQGNNIAGPESLRWIAEGIADLVNGSDYVLINGQSRQASELRGA